MVFSISITFLVVCFAVVGAILITPFPHWPIYFRIWQHVLFDPTIVFPPGEASCSSELLRRELSELSSIMTEFIIYYRELAGSSDPGFRARVLNNFFERSIANCSESVAGILRAVSSSSCLRRRRGGRGWMSPGHQ